MSGIYTVETLLFNVRLSVRYHNRRRAFFDSLSFAIGAGQTILPLVALGLLFKFNNTLVLWPCIAIALLCFLNLAVRPDERAHVSHSLARRFILLEQKVLPADADAFATLYAEKLAIEADEPAPLHVLAILCHNDQIGAEGIDAGRRVALRWWQRLFAHVLDLPPTPLPPRA